MRPDLAVRVCRRAWVAGVHAICDLQTLIAERIKLCDIAGTLGHASFPSTGDVQMCMKLAGFLLLLAGWSIVVAAVVLAIPANMRTIFVLAGAGVEIIGLTLVIRSNPMALREKE
jgi:hypothetical protein